MKQVKDWRRHDRPDNAPDDEGDLLLPGRRAKDLSGFEILEIIIRYGRGCRQRCQDKQRKSDDCRLIGRREMRAEKR